MQTFDHLHQCQNEQPLHVLYQYMCQSNAPVTCMGVEDSGDIGGLKSCVLPQHSPCSVKLGIHMHVCICVCVYGKYQNTKTNREDILIYGYVCVYA